ncbi:MAG: branched-chain amino acid ABC transporter permease [Parachlamydia sp.]|nr:branched-chain amino acid ABC transporter permease [Parachlamydia sp.]
METLLFQIGNGLIIGSVYVLIALGLNLIWSITDIADFAQGSYYVVAAYVSYYAVTMASFPFVLSLLLGMAVGAVMAYLSERFLYRRWQGQGRVQLLCAIALFFLIANVANALWTSKAKIFPDYWEGVIPGTGYSYERVVVLVVSAVLFLLMYFFIMKTRMGKAIRATSQDSGMAQVLGINISTVNSVVFLLGGALSGAAAVLVAPLYTVFPSMGDLPLLKALVVVILGGFGSVAGVLICGLGLGVIEALGAIYVSSAYQHGYAFFILLLVLMLKPKGLFGRV